MIVGGFGDVIFETSDKRILTYKNFRRDIIVRYGISEVIGQKPKSEFLGPGLDTVTFEVSLNISLGHDPYTIMTQFIEYTREGHAYPLVIGSRAIGVDRWKITGLGEPVYSFGPEGQILSGALELTMEEYVE